MLKKLKPLKFGVILIISVFLTLGFSISLQSLLAAWTAPSANPPNNNISDLNLGGGLSVALNALVNGNFTTMGKVGVGTTSPDSQLHLYKNSSSENAEIAIQSGNGTAVQDKWSIYQDGFGGGLRFWNNNVPSDKNALTILKNGNVGIGVSVPTEKIDVNGTVKASQINSGQYCDQNGGNCKVVTAMGGGSTNIQTFTSSGTWIKPSSGTMCRITVVGGGGGGGGGSAGGNPGGTGSSGGTTSFGSIISKSGGSGGISHPLIDEQTFGLRNGLSGENFSFTAQDLITIITGTGGTGGTLTNKNGGNATGNVSGGGGGVSDNAYDSSSAGGGGGVSQLTCFCSALPSTVTVTVGIGGNGGSRALWYVGNGGNGVPGMAVVEVW